MSLKKIAEMAGVSASTVSRVLNNASPACASRETQDRIWEAARSIGYVPNETARKLKKASEAPAETRSVTIVMARVASLEADPFFYELFRSLEVELMKQSMVIRQTLYAEESLAENPMESDGFIILGRCSRRLLAHISACSRNIVGIWRNPMDFHVDEVVCDGEKAAELAMNHLLSLGHRRIAYIGDCSYESRYVGYCNTLFRNHISMDYSLIRPTDQTREQAEPAFRELLEQKVSGKADFSAVFCANDATAVRVLEILAQQKKKLREAISVISIDDIEEAQNTKPYLTTIHIPRDEMAHMAVNLLLDRTSRGHKEPVRIEFPCRIVQRESCYRCVTT
ncbi:MAG: LacI family transcriptional regulator [Lachnospiraceae bacterium]|nr:LacI family transcriptional regulator [Lachnospiraceae bacterium]